MTISLVVMTIPGILRSLPAISFPPQLLLQRCHYKIFSQLDATAVLSEISLWREAMPSNDHLSRGNAVMGIVPIGNLAKIMIVTAAVRKY